MVETDPVSGHHQLLATARTIDQYHHNCNVLGIAPQITLRIVVSIGCWPAKCSPVRNLAFREGACRQQKIGSPLRKMDIINIKPTGLNTTQWCLTGQQG